MDHLEKDTFSTCNSFKVYYHIYLSVSPSKCHTICILRQTLTPSLFHEKYKVSTSTILEFMTPKVQLKMPGTIKCG